MKEEHSSYISRAIQKYCLNGDAYISEENLFHLCRQRQKALSWATFQADLTEQLQLKRLSREGSRIYLPRTLRYENFAVNRLATILKACALNPVVLPPVERLAPLCQEQKEAAELALSNRLSIILGGAGSGKTTLIETILIHCSTTHIVLCAPTGKAARNLQNRINYEARTVHSALGMKPDDDFLQPVEWESIDLVIVDEASMITLEMLTGILCKLEKRPDACIVLLGDPNQLLSVGSGNILPDLLALGIPCYELKENHRQDGNAAGLLHNVTRFNHMVSAEDLIYDSSFELKEQSEATLRTNLIEDAAQRYLSGESVQVLSPFNDSTDLSAKALNEAIREKVNPPTKGKLALEYREKLFRDGDRVMILKNDRNQNCSNGDVGIFRIVSGQEGFKYYSVYMPDGRISSWEDGAHLENLGLAYALTVHKVQGSEWDTILMPLVNEFSGMLYRNLLYTAISRAKKHVIIYGDRDAINTALQRKARKRASVLVSKTHMCSRKTCA